MRICRMPLALRGDGPGEGALREGDFPSPDRARPVCHLCCHRAGAPCHTLHCPPEPTRARVPEPVPWGRLTECPQLDSLPAVLGAGRW